MTTCLPFIAYNASETECRSATLNAKVYADRVCAMLKLMDNKEKITFLIDEYYGWYAAHQILFFSENRLKLMFCFARMSVLPLQENALPDFAAHARTAYNTVCQHPESNLSLILRLINNHISPNLAIVCVRHMTIQQIQLFIRLVSTGHMQLNAFKLAYVWKACIAK